MATLDGWDALSEYVLRFTLDDGSTVLDVDVESATTLEELIELINLADERETGDANQFRSSNHKS
ncbi:hypothetical protein [Vibrio taketomensis]|uniref:hypothetical protein n=1 Tax=Vibrio taketomensis TaxID=2572923 RepID=UPI0013899738|nr:hypothetical protein [Vibrio taketomensis]